MSKLEFPQDDSPSKSNPTDFPESGLSSERSPAVRPSDLWARIAPVLKSMVRENVFERWFADARLDHDEDGTWVLTVPSDTHCLWIETNFMPELCSSLGTALDLAEAGQVRVRAGDAVPEVEEDSTSDEPRVEGELFAELSTSSDADGQLKRLIKRARLNPANTFDRFVVGSSNEFAHAACLAVAQGKGRLTIRSSSTGAQGWARPTWHRLSVRSSLRTGPRPRWST